VAVMIGRPTIDTVAIKGRVDLLGLIGTDTRLKRVAATRGGEYAGACPWCGGQDRFRVQPERGRWWCRGCSDGPRWQDAIAYVRQRDGVDFVEACRRLGASASELGTRPADALYGAARPGRYPRRPNSATASATRRAAGPPPLQPRSACAPPSVVLPEDQTPNPTWQAAGLALVAEAEAALWSEAGERARAYLASRGLREATLRAWRVGFQPDPGRREPAERWGFPATDANGKPVWLRIPRGIVLPWLDDDQLWQLKVRTSQPRLKYLAISGGHPCLYGADTLVPGELAILAEGEFDAQLLWQEAGDLVGVASLGSASRWPTPHALRYLAACSGLLLATDADDEGDQGADRLALVLPGRTWRLRPPLGKDATEYRRLGGNVRDWVRFELRRGEGPQAVAGDRLGSRQHKLAGGGHP
jgi:DNA primase